MITNDNIQSFCRAVYDMYMQAKHNSTRADWVRTCNTALAIVDEYDDQIANDIVRDIYAELHRVFNPAQPKPANPDAADRALFRDIYKLISAVRSYTYATPAELTHDYILPMMRMHNTQLARDTICDISAAISSAA